MTRLRPLLRPLARLAGAALVLAALAYLGREAFLYREGLSPRDLPAGTLPLVAALGAVYGAALLLLAEQWHRIVAIFGTEPRGRTYPSYTMTLVARYLPGNVFHIVGRAAWLHDGPLGGGALARASFLELVLTPLGALILLFTLLPVLPLGEVTLAGFPAPLAAAAGLAAATGAALQVLNRRGALRAALGPLLLSAGFMAILGASFAALAAFVAGIPAPLAAAAALAAWLVGYATPGAPGGIGVREAVLVALLAGTAAPEQALLLALLFRGVTIVGDGVCFLLGLALAAHWRRQPPAIATQG
jgi:uncharacterized membrane protein YbhN (UPF0104 family)